MEATNAVPNYNGQEGHFNVHHSSLPRQQLLSVGTNDPDLFLLLNTNLSYLYPFPDAPKLV